VSRSALQALTAAALALPGLAPSTAHAQDDAAVLQFGRYQESSRDLFGLSSKYSPLRSDSLFASGWSAFTDRFKATISLRQDTWSGATPIATAPREFRGNRSRAADGISGASPYIVNNGPLYLDKATHNPLRTDGFGNLTGGQDTQVVHTIAGASRETRRQVDFDLRQEWNEGALGVNGGYSYEPDYISRFVGVGGQWDLDQKLTTINAGLAYTSSDISATLDHDALPYIFNACGNPSCNFVSSTAHIENTDAGGKILYGKREDWSATLGVTQVLTANAQVQANVGYTRSQGYLSNPYKLVTIAFIDPKLQFLAPSPDVLVVDAGAIMEKRPDLRKQWLANIRYAQYIESADAGLHLNYAYFSDDWGIRAHTFEVEWAQPLGAGWTLTPMARYYTQTAASFYTPYLVTEQGQYSTSASGARVPFDLAKLPPYYSSDYRLSAFGTLGGGFTLSKEFARGATAYLGYSYFQHSGNLKWGGGGAGTYADFNWWLVNASVKFDLDAAASAMSGSEHAGHHHEAGGNLAPAGVMFGHVLPAAGDFMAALTLMGTRQAGGFRKGTHGVDDASLKADGCDANGCLVAPSWMNASMYMLELMYAPLDWLTLMVMPTYMNMSMQSRGLLTAQEQASLPPDVQAMYLHHTSHEHSSGGIGDTGLYAMFRLFDGGAQRAHLSLGVTAPTGDVSVKLRDTHQIDAGFDHYGMQLGSGTWDFNPSVTYQASLNPWFFGAQASAVVRMQDRNASGYALGNVFQATAWAGCTSDEGFSVTLRGVYTQQGAIRGAYNGTFYQLSPLDYRSNYGGRFWDVGLGASYTFNGTLAGNRLAVEWLQPVADDFNGYQLERRGTLYATWHYHF
jgi:hypothetical protein